MKNVQAELTAYLEDTYFRATPVVKSHGINIDGREELEEDLRNFLEAIPLHIEIEDGQYAAIVRWIDAKIGHVKSEGFSQETEMSILTYINSCYFSKRVQ